MPFSRPSLSVIVNRVLAGIKSRLSLDQMRRSDAEVYAREISGASHELHGHLDFIAAQVIVDTAEAEYLDRHATIWLKDKARKPASPAIGYVTVTGTDGAVIATDTVYVSQAGLEYVVQADAVIASSTANVLIKSVLGQERTDRGSLANLAAGEVLTLSETIEGVAGSATVGSDGISGGTDQEDDVSVRERTINRIQEPPHGGARNDYVDWAKEVPGVTRAWEYPLELGPGSVTVRFMRDNDADPIPSAGEVETVQEYMDKKRPVTVKQFLVVAPIPEPVNYTIAVTPNTAAVRAAVEAELRDLHRRVAVPGGTLPHSHMNEAISLAEGETDHTLLSPAASVVSATGKISTFGAITWI